MYRITSQLCEVFNCTEQQLVKKGILDEFRAWLKEHPECSVSIDLLAGEAINGDIALKFFDSRPFKNRTHIKDITCRSNSTLKPGSSTEMN